MEYSRRLARVPDSYFGKTMGQEVKHGPLPLINMAVGVPDGETPPGILDTFAEALYQPENQKYGAFHGKATFKQAITQFYKRHYDVDLDPEEEVCILYGTENGLVSLPTSIVNPGENVLLPIQATQITWLACYWQMPFLYPFNLIHRITYQIGRVCLQILYPIRSSFI